MDECEAPKRKQGRQTKYTPAKAKEILRRLAGGETLTSICRDMQIPPSTVYQWTVDRNDFAVDFACARDLFQLLLKGCTIEAKKRFLPHHLSDQFQLLLKGCTIEAIPRPGRPSARNAFQLLLKGCTIEALRQFRMFLKTQNVSVVVERMYD